MNILIIPFHDWRKIIKEGFRTRDAHFIEVFSKKNKFKKLIVNRPITLLEILLKKKGKKIKGEIILTQDGFTLYKIQENTFLIDFISKNILKQIFQRYKWYINTYSDKKYLLFINSCLLHLEIEEYSVISQNVFAYKLVEKLNSNLKVFDAWDNFTKFRVYQSILDEVKKGYRSHAKQCDFWITNAKENITDFSREFRPNQVYLISNGVDLGRFVNKNDNELPKDLAKIKKPIVGFGGKITQLLDINLINSVIKNNPEVSFVFVGQKLDKDVFNKISKKHNFYYLGDKHYDVYSNYVKNFDICIVPYVTKEEQKSGANSIKVYEYLATGKKVLGTSGNGLEDLKEYLYLVDNSEEFSKELETIKNEKKNIDLELYSWDNKVNTLVKLMKNENINQ